MLSIVNSDRDRILVHNRLVKRIFGPNGGLKMLNTKIQQIGGKILISNLNNLQ